MKIYWVPLTVLKMYPRIADTAGSDAPSHHTHTRHWCREVNAFLQKFVFECTRGSCTMRWWWITLCGFLIYILTVFILLFISFYCIIFISLCLCVLGACTYKYFFLNLYTRCGCFLMLAHNMARMCFLHLIEINTISGDIKKKKFRF